MLKQRWQSNSPLAEFIEKGKDFFQMAKYLLGGQFAEKIGDFE